MRTTKGQLQLYAKIVKLFGARKGSRIKQANALVSLILSDSYYEEEMENEELLQELVSDGMRIIDEEPEHTKQDLDDIWQGITVIVEKMRAKL